MTDAEKKMLVAGRASIVRAALSKHAGKFKSDVADVALEALEPRVKLDDDGQAIDVAGLVKEFLAEHPGVAAEKTAATPTVRTTTPAATAAPSTTPTTIGEGLAAAYAGIKVDDE